MIAKDITNRTGGLTFVYLQSGNERFIFLFDDAHVGECLDTIKRFEADAEIGLDHEAASILRCGIIKSASARAAMEPTMMDGVHRDGSTSEPGWRWRAAIGLLLSIAGMLASAWLNLYVERL